MMSPGLSEHFDHKIVTEPLNSRVQIFVDGELVAETMEAIKLNEDGYDPIIYIPREHIRDLKFIKQDDYHCPYKGKAEIYAIKHNSQVFKNAAWSYRETYDEFRELKDMVAFSPGKVQAIKITG